VTKEEYEKLREEEEKERQNAATIDELNGGNGRGAGYNQNTAISVADRVRYGLTGEGYNDKTVAAFKAAKRAGADRSVTLESVQNAMGYNDRDDITWYRKGEQQTGNAEYNNLTKKEKKQQADAENSGTGKDAGGAQKAAGQTIAQSTAGAQKKARARAIQEMLLLGDKRAGGKYGGGVIEKDGNAIVAAMIAEAGKKAAQSAKYGPLAAEVTADKNAGGQRSESAATAAEALRTRQATDQNAAKYTDDKIMGGTGRLAAAQEATARKEAAARAEKYRNIDKMVNEDTRAGGKANELMNASVDTLLGLQADNAGTAPYEAPQMNFKLLGDPGKNYIKQDDVDRWVASANPNEKALIGGAAIGGAEAVKTGESLIKSLVTTLGNVLNGIYTMGGALPENELSRGAKAAAEAAAGWTNGDELMSEVVDRYKMDKDVADFQATIWNMMYVAIAGDVVGGAAAGATGAGANSLIAAQKTANLTDAAQKVMIGASAMGSAVTEAYQKTGNIGQAVNYGLTSGMVEALIESISGGIPGLPKGILSEDLKKWLKFVGKSPLLSMGVDTIGEGLEEVVSTFLEPYIKTAILKEELKPASIDEYTKSFMMGAAGSLFMQGTMGLAGKALGDSGTDIKTTVDSDIWQSINDNYEMAESWYETLKNNPEATAADINKAKAYYEQARAAYDSYAPAGAETATKPAESVSTEAATGTKPAENVSTEAATGTKPAENVSTEAATETKPAESVSIKGKEAVGTAGTEKAQIKPGAEVKAAAAENTEVKAVAENIRSDTADAEKTQVKPGAAAKEGEKNRAGGQEYTDFSNTQARKKAMKESAKHVIEGLKAADEAERAARADIKAKAKENAAADTAAAGDTETGTKKTAKGEAVQAQNVRAVSRAIEQEFGIRHADAKVEMKETVQEIAEALRSGDVTDEQIDKLYKLADENGGVQEAIYPQYEAARNVMKDSAIRVPERVKADFGDDWAAFVRNNRGRINFSNETTRGIDSLYEEMNVVAGEDFFPSGETDLGEMLKKMANFMEATTPTTVPMSDYFEASPENQKAARDRIRGIIEGLADTMSEVESYDREKNAKADARSAKYGEGVTLEEAMAPFEDKTVYRLQKEVDKIISKTALTERERTVVDSMMKGAVKPGDLEAMSGINATSVMELYNAKSALAEARAPFEAYKSAQKAARDDMAKSVVELSGFDDIKDKIGLLYDRETPQRNNIDALGKDGGETVNSEYFDGVKTNEAARTRWINEHQQQILDLGLEKMNTYERQYTMMLGENAEYLATGTVTKKSAEIQDALSLKMDDLLAKHGSSIDAGKCEQLAVEMMKQFKEVKLEWDRALTENGYTPSGYIENYWPHMQEDKPGTIFTKVMNALGMKVNSDTLPTEIAGLTDTRTPGRRWDPFALTRTGDATQYDAIANYEKYMESASQQIFHTEDILKLRALENEIRYRYSDAGTKERVDGIRNDPTKTEEDKDVLIKDIWKNNPTTNANGYVRWLHEYTNGIAGKKSFADRQMEAELGRAAYDSMSKIEGRIASNMVGYNIGTGIMNLAPLAQSVGSIDVKYLAKGILETAKGYVNNADADFVDQSDFLTNRRGVGSLEDELGKVEDAKSLVRKLQTSGAAWMSLCDNIVSDSIVRARVEQNTAKGMDYEDAMDEAGKFAAGLMADRSLGATPTMFNWKNPLAKMVTMFQIEQNNQFSYLFKDLPREKKEEGAAAVVLGMVKAFIGARIFNWLAGKVMGRDDSLPDPIKYIWDVGSGIAKGEDAATLIADTGGDIIEQIPGIGSMIGGGRFPISSALPDGSKLLKGLTSGGLTTDEGRDYLKQALINPASYLLLPTGGGQIRKTAQGLETVVNGGSFSGVGDKKQMQFSLNSADPGQVAQALLFGKWSTPQAQEYINGGFKKLSATETALLPQAKEQGFTPTSWYDTMMGLKNLAAEKDGAGNTVKSEAQVKRDALMANADLTPEQKAWIDRNVLQTSEEKVDYDFSSNDAYKRSVITAELPGRYLDGIAGAQEKGIGLDKYAAIATALSAAKSEKNENGETVKGVTEAQQEVLLADRDLTPEQKAWIDQNVIQAGRKKPKARDYTDANAFAYSGLTDAEKALVAAGASAEQARDYAKAGIDVTTNSIYDLLGVPEDKKTAVNGIMSGSGTDDAKAWNIERLLGLDKGDGDAYVDGWKFAQAGDGIRYDYAGTGLPEAEQATAYAIISGTSGKDNRVNAIIDEMLLSPAEAEAVVNLADGITKYDKLSKTMKGRVDALVDTYGWSRGDAEKAIDARAGLKTLDEYKEALKQIGMSDKMAEQLYNVW